MLKNECEWYIEFAVWQVVINFFKIKKGNLINNRKWNDKDTNGVYLTITSFHTGSGNLLFWVPHQALKRANALNVFLSVIWLPQSQLSTTYEDAVSLTWR